MGILDRVTAASEAGEDYIKALLWGPNGSGKSTICGTAPKPILYAYTERQGLVAFKRMAPEENTLPIKSIADLRMLLKELNQPGHGYASVCLDSFTEMQQLLIDELVARKNVEPDKPTRITFEEHGFIHDKSKNTVRAFRDLPMNVVLTCLSERSVVGEGSDSRVVTQVMLSGRKLPQQLGQYFNIVGFCYKTVTSNGNTKHRVALDARPDLDVKGMPGLRYREDPDISYWYDRAIGGAEPRNEEAKMLGDVERGE